MPQDIENLRELLDDHDTPCIDILLLHDEENGYCIKDLVKRLMEESKAKEVVNLATGTRNGSEMSVVHAFAFLLGKLCGQELQQLSVSDNEGG